MGKFILRLSYTLHTSEPYVFVQKIVISHWAIAVLLTSLTKFNYCNELNQLQCTIVVSVPIVMHYGCDKSR